MLFYATKNLRRNIETRLVIQPLLTLSQYIAHKQMSHYLFTVYLLCTLIYSFSSTIKLNCSFIIQTNRTAFPISVSNQNAPKKKHQSKRHYKAAKPEIAESSISSVLSCHTQFIAFCSTFGKWSRSMSGETMTRSNLARETHRASS